MTAHTPGPYYYEPKQDGPSVAEMRPTGDMEITTGGPSSLIATVYDCGSGTAKANAQFIVQACNSFAELLAACEALQQSLKQLRGGSLRRQVEEETALELGRVAIAKAKGEEKR